MAADDFRKSVARPLGQIPSGLFILTARNADERGGMLASWVQQVCFEPPVISVSVAKGRPVMTLISGSRQFSLCQIPEDDKVLMRRFAKGTEPGQDPFMGLDLVAPTNAAAPILGDALGYLECELIAHLDVEGDHDLFVGRVIGGGALSSAAPHVHIRKDGFKY